MHHRQFFAILSAFLLSTFSFAAENEGILNSQMASPGTPQLSVEWWQWAMSAPEAESPVSDLTGVKCSAGQRGDTWFLAGGFGSSKIHRTCSVPAGKKLFFPLINMVHWPKREGEPITCEDAKLAAALNNETAIDLFAEVDGIALENLGRHRLKSDGCFDLFARVPASERPYNAYPSASDGYWMLLQPLPHGRHVIKFGGRYNHASSEYGRMVQDIEYVLFVQ